MRQRAGVEAADGLSEFESHSLLPMKDAGAQVIVEQLRGKMADGLDVCTLLVDKLAFILRRRC